MLFNQWLSWKGERESWYLLCRSLALPFEGFPLIPLRPHTILSAGDYGDRLDSEALFCMGHITKLFYFQAALSHFLAWVVLVLPRPFPV